MSDAGASREQSMAAAITHTAQTYDSVPYLSFPFARLHPARLGAIGHILGLAPCPVNQARILEIGCATGGHLIPIAASYPGAEVLGLDISSTQIKLGNERIARLNLSNIRLETRSLTELCEADGPFDYIICHGVFSWIPEALRNELLRVVSERLSPAGIALISFNVLPGWRLYQVVRDSMILHAGTQSSHEQRTAWTRFMFQAMEKHAPENTTYGQIWRREAQRMSALPDFYLEHEIFEDHNNPSTFTKFIETARMHQLCYLAETRLASNIPEHYSAEIAELIRGFGENDPIRTEQYIDIVTGRSFRESLLIRADQAQRINRRLDPAYLENLHFAATNGTTIQTNDDGTCRIHFDDSESHVTSQSIATAMKRMLAARPATSSFDELSHFLSQSERRRLLETLLRFVCDGSIDIRSEPIVCLPDVSEKPTVWPLAASDAASGLSQTATLCHTPYLLSPFAQFLLPLLDGTRDRNELFELVYAQAVHSATNIIDEAGRAEDDIRIREISLNILNQELSRLAKAGMLLR